MKTIQSATSAYYPSYEKRSAITRFFEWTQEQEKNRFTWLALGVAGHGCVITPIALIAVVFSGNNIMYWPFIMAAMTATLITNLAAMSTKVTIPVFLASVFIDVFVIAHALV